MSRFVRWAAIGLFVLVSAVLSVRGLRALLEPSDLKPQVIECNIGTVLPQSTIERTVKVFNPLSRPLTLKKIYADCSCIAKSLSSEQIDPGGEAEAQLRFNSGDGTGDFRHEVTVLFEESRVPITIAILGRVEGWLRSHSGPFKFGEVSAGSVGHCEGELCVDVPWPDDEIEVENPIVDLKFEARSRSDDPTKLALSARFSPPLESELGSRWGELKFSWKGRPERAWTLPWSAVVVSSTELFPRTANFGVLAPGEISRRSVQWKQRGKEMDHRAANLISSSDLGDALQLTFRDQDRGEIQIEMTLTEALLERKGVVTSSVEITDRLIDAKVRVPILAYVTQD